MSDLNDLRRKDNGINSDQPHIGANVPMRMKRRIGTLRLVNLAVRALKSSDPAEVRIGIALQLLRSIKRLSRFGQIRQRDTELMIQVELASGDWYCARWIDYYRGCLFGSLIPLRSECGQLVSELPANRLSGIQQAAYSRHIVNIRHTWENFNANSETIQADLLAWERSALA